MLTNIANRRGRPVPIANIVASVGFPFVDPGRASATPPPEVQRRVWGTAYHWITERQHRLRQYEIERLARIARRDSEHVSWDDHDQVAQVCGP